jgi:16S rRNA (cytosine1402-N4)-methyltransferase
MVELSNGFSHRPVLYHEIIHALQPSSGGLYVDCTLGAGGHAFGILQASSPDGLLLGLDVDPQALKLASQRLTPFASRVTIVQASYITLLEKLKTLDWQGVNGILIDLGVSSMQLDTPERGFSFRSDAPLDMRFDPANQVTAAELVNTLSEAELAWILYKFGEEKLSRKISRAIIANRPLYSTRQLADVVSEAVGGKVDFSRKQRIHPATKTFQALRIAVNRELDALETVLPQAVSALTTKGRLAIIAFHSLEDRIIKQFFRQESRDCICPPKQPQCTCDHRAQIVEINRRPIRANDQEVEDNPRSRSARLRVVEKLEVAKNN